MNKDSLILAFNKIILQTEDRKNDDFHKKVVKLINFCKFILDKQVLTIKNTCYFQFDKLFQFLKEKKGLTES